MNNNKSKVIGVRFDDITHQRLTDLATRTQDSVSAIIRRATVHCLPAFERSPDPVEVASPPEPDRAPGAALPDEIPDADDLEPQEPRPEPDVFNLLGEGYGTDTGNDSQGPREEVAEGERSVVVSDK